MENHLSEVINRGRGSALICALIECPNCKKDIWIEFGYHCGFDAVMDFIGDHDCYCCLHNVKVDLNETKMKESKFFTIDEFTDLVFNEFNRNNVEN